MTVRKICDSYVHLHGLVIFTGLLVSVGTVIFCGCGSTPTLYTTGGDVMQLPKEDASEEVLLTSQGSTDPSPDEENPAKEEAMLVVHLCGAVNNPGVYELDIDSRIIDGIRTAGGFSEDASKDSLNLAMELNDGSRIYVPTVEEAKAMRDGVADTSDITEECIADPVVSGDSDKSDGRVNINTADEAALMTLTGVGATRAKSIISYRDEHGGFGSIEEIMNVSGIGQASFEKIRDDIKVR